MSARRRSSAEIALRRASLHEKTLRAISPLPPPEEVFSDWLLSLPADVDIETAARSQIAIIDRHPASHPDLDCLRILLSALASSSGTDQRQTL